MNLLVAVKRERMSLCRSYRPAAAAARPPGDSWRRDLHARCTDARSGIGDGCDIDMRRTDSGDRPIPQYRGILHDHKRIVW